MPLKLVNPQPMETLPDDAEVFVKYRYDTRDHEGGIVVDRWNPDLLLEGRADVGSIFYAWSYTATFEEGE